MMKGKNKKIIELSFNGSSMAVDWRKQLRINEHRTHMVIGIFILTYVMIGLIVDWYIHPEFDQLPTLEALKLLVTFQVVPIATLILAMVAVISILVTYALHDRLMLLGTECHEVNPNSASTQEQQLYNVAEELKIAAGLHYMPKIYVIDADYMNAFASGYSEKSALIAITRGLLAKLDRSELQAVIAHELNHIRHHDIKLTLMASVLSNIILIVLDIMFRGVIFGGRGRRRDSSGKGNIVILVVILLRILLPIITVLLLLYLSRRREFMADAGAVELTRDNEPLARALLKISNDHDVNKEKYAMLYHNTAHEEVRREAYIFDPTQAGISLGQSIGNMFSTHPPLAERLAALGFRGR